jgi:hypothetical protein
MSCCTDKKENSLGALCKINPQDGTCYLAGVAIANRPTAASLTEKHLHRMTLA